MWNENGTLERVSLQFRPELLNLFNRHFFGGVGMNMDDSYLRTHSDGLWLTHGPIRYEAGLVR